MTPRLLKAGRMACIFLLTLICMHAHTQSSLSFDGTDDYVSVPHNASLNVTNFSFEAWVNLSSTTGGLTIVSKGDGSNGALTNYIFNVGSNSSNSRLGLFAGGAWYSANTSLSIGVWYHAAVTVSGTAVTFYLNGVSDGTATLSGAMYTAGTYLFKIGEQGDVCNCNRMNGKVEEVRVWNTTRTSAEIKAYLFKNPAVSTAGLVAYYMFNTGSGISAINSSTNTTGIDGTLLNGPSWTPSPVQFAPNALGFNGSSNYVQLNNRINIGSSNFTFEVWVNPASTTAGMVFAQDVCGDAEHQFRLYTNSSRVNFDLSDAAALGAPYSFQLPSTANSVPLNTWTHIAIVRNGNNYSLYINGVFNASTSTGANTINNQSGADVNKRFRIGARGGVATGCGLNYFNGKIDELRFWNIVRTATEIQQNYLKEIDPAINANLASYFSFNQGMASGTNTALTTLYDQKGNNNGSLTGFSLTGSTSNFITQNSSVTLLPLKWLSFTAQKQTNGVLLRWNTASEINTARFTIQHKTEADDWKIVDAIPSINDGRDQHQYSYLHNSAREGINYYRIVQYDNDGKFSYSEIRTLKVIGQIRSFKVIANPVRIGIVLVEINRTATAPFTLLTSDGKIVWRKKLTQGMNEIHIGVQPGTYLLTDGVYTEKLMVK